MKRQNRAKATKVTLPTVANLVALVTELTTLALYDPSNPDAPLKPLHPDLIPNGFADRLAVMQIFNAKAVRRKRVFRLMGVFPRSEVPRYTGG